MDRLYLLIAILSEVAATSALKASEGFSHAIPSAITVVGYGVAFYCLSFALRSIPVGIAYAIWSGAGIVLLAIIGYFLYRQTLDLPAVIGIALILAGVLVLNLFSKSVAH